MGLLFDLFLNNHLLFFNSSHKGEYKLATLQNTSEFLKEPHKIYKSNTRQSAEKAASCSLQTLLNINNNIFKSIFVSLQTNKNTRGMQYNTSYNPFLTEQIHFMLSEIKTINPTARPGQTSVDHYRKNRLADKHITLD